MAGRDDLFSQRDHRLDVGGPLRAATGANSEVDVALDRQADQVRDGVESDLASSTEFPNASEEVARSMSALSLAFMVFVGL